MGDVAAATKAGTQAHHESESGRIASYPDVGHLAILATHVLEFLLGHAWLQVAKVCAATPGHLARQPRF